MKKKCLQAILILGIVTVLGGTACASKERQQGNTLSEQAVLRDCTYYEDEAEYMLSKEDTAEIRKLLSKKSGWKEEESCECIGSYELILDDARYVVDLGGTELQIKYGELGQNVTGAIANNNEEVIEEIHEILIDTIENYEMGKNKILVGEDDIVRVEIKVYSELEEFLNELPEDISIEDDLEELEEKEAYTIGTVFLNKEYYKPKSRYEMYFTICLVVILSVRDQ